MKYDVTCSYGFDTKPEYNYNITTDGSNWVHIPPVGTSDFPIGISSRTTSTGGKTVNINAPTVEWSSPKTIATTSSTGSGITYNPNSTTTATVVNDGRGNFIYKGRPYHIDVNKADDLQRIIDCFGGHLNDLFAAYEKAEEEKAAAELKKVQERNKRLRGMVEKITFSGPVTVIKWSDGTITRVRCADDETYDREKGVLAAMAKKLYENTNIFVEELYNWCLEEEEIEVKEEISPKISEKDYRILKKLFK